MLIRLDQKNIGWIFASLNFFLGQERLIQEFKNIVVGAEAKMTFSITEWIDIHVRIESLARQHYVGKITAVDPNYNLILFTGENRS